MLPQLCHLPLWARPIFVARDIVISLLVFRVSGCDAGETRVGEGFENIAARESLRVFAMHLGQLVWVSLVGGTRRMDVTFHMAAPGLLGLCYEM